MDTREITLAGLISFALEKQSKAIRVGMPGRVEKFDKATQTATIKPLLFEHDEAEDGTELNEPVGLISGVPVQFPCANGFILTFPVVKGDKVWLQFSDRSLENWYKRGADVDPVDLRRHALSDAVAILGVLADPDKLTEFDATRAVFGKQGGKRIAVSGTEVHLGVDHNEVATDFIALAPATKSELQAIRDDVANLRSTLTGHVHDASTIITTATVGPSAVVGVQSGATGPGPTLAAPPLVGNIASLHVKSK